jgi:alpha-galactosidase
MQLLCFKNDKIMNIKKCLLLTLLLSTSTVLSIAQSIKYNIKPDGTFDIKGSSVEINNCYPAINNRSLKPVKLNITQKGNAKTIQYTLVDGTFELNFAYEGNALAITATVNSKNNEIGLVSILRDAETKGAERVYRTSTQIIGQGGLKDWPKDKWDYSSCGALTGLVPDSGVTMVVSTRDFNKYMSYTNLYPYELNGGKKMVDICIANENLPLAKLPTFYFTENKSAYVGMQEEAKAIAKFMGVKADKKQTYHWCSWYYAYYHLTQNMLSDYLKGFNTITPRVPIQTIQIDAGYHPHAGDWLEPNHRFPQGIEASVKEIIANNYRAGVWIGPYMVGNKSKIYLEHPDWILKYKDGSPIINMSFYAEDRLWGAMDEEIYTLDTSNPQVMEYLRTVFRTFKKMGITFFKTDFMLYGSQASNNVKRHTPGKSSIEYQREFFEMIRQEIGEESFWLGCIAPFQPMLGYADGMRISADITPEWKGGTSMFNESKGGQHYNNVWWQNDPDAIILRSKYNHMTDDETRSLILWMGMLGGMVNTSDLFYDIPMDRTNLYKFLEPGDDKITATFPLLMKHDKLEAMVKKYSSKNSYAILFTNRNDDAVTSTYSLNSLLDDNATKTVFNWNEKGSEKIDAKNELTVTLKPHESKLFYISKDGKSPGKMTVGGKEK